MSIVTIKRKIIFLKGLGFKSYKIAQKPELFHRNEETLKDDFDYFKDILKIKKNQILIQPALLTMNPDAIAIKLRILKTNVMGLNKRDLFNPNKFIRFITNSPATIAAKKRFCLDNKINYKKNINILKFPWLINSIESRLPSQKQKRIARNAVIHISKSIN